MGLVFLAFLIFGLYLAIPAKTAQAVNNYIDNTKLYKNDLGLYTLEFNVKTSFTWGNWLWCYNSNCQGLLGRAGFDLDKEVFGTPQASLFYDTIPACYTTPLYRPRTGTYENGTACDLVAGNTYKMNIDNFYVWDISQSTYWLKNFHDYNLNSGDILNLISGWFYPAGDSNEPVAFSEFPGLSISYPQENDEIADAFYVQGNYTLPASSNLDTLLVMVNEVGIYGITYYGFFQENLGLSGSVNVRVSGVASGDYEIFFAFMEYEDDSNIFIPPVSVKIKVLESIPPELPGTQEIPPDIFSTLSAQAIYLTYSNYSTSTALFGAFSGAIEPLITVIGDNLTFFSSQFNQDTAKDTGEKAGNAVLLIRSYAGNINSFFNDMPISEILFLYLSALVAVIVFRLIRLLIKLIPFI